MDITVYLFPLGVFMVLKLIYFIFDLIKISYFGTPVSTKIYGTGSWAVVTGASDGIGK
jgi:hypothetical protein